MEITGLFIYPIKSLGGISLQSSEVEMRGLKYDRRWMLVDENYRFLSQRELPVLAKFSMALNTDFLVVTNGFNNESINVPLLSENTHQQKVVVWDDEIMADILNPEISQWFSQQLGRKVHLVYQNEESIRPVDSKYAVTGEEHTSFSDGYPILVVSEESLNYLNKLCTEHISMERFRPNIVVKDLPAFEEDNLGKICVNDAELYGVKPCARCIVTTLDPETNKFSKEPLQTLSKIRKFGNKILFGQNLVVHKIGKMNIGDSVNLQAVWSE